MILKKKEKEKHRAISEVFRMVTSSKSHLPFKEFALNFQKGSGPKMG